MKEMVLLLQVFSLSHFLLQNRNVPLLFDLLPSLTLWAPCFLYAIRERVRGGEGTCKITEFVPLLNLSVWPPTHRHNWSLACFEHAGRRVDETCFRSSWRPTGADLLGSIDQVLDRKPLSCDIGVCDAPLAPFAEGRCMFWKRSPWH